MVADKVTMAARMDGIAGDPFKEIFISNVLRSEVNPNYHTASSFHNNSHNSTRSTIYRFHLSQVKDEKHDIT